MPTRGPFVRLLVGAGVLCAAVLALAGALALRGPGVVAVMLAGVVAACLAAGVARELPEPRRTNPMDAAVLAAGWAMGVLILLAGTAALAGAIAAAVATALGGLTGLAVWLLRSSRSGRTDEEARSTAEAAGTDAMPPPRSLPVPPWRAGPAAGAGRPDAAGSARLTAPVSDLPTDALGREWLRTSAALTGWLEPAARESIVRRRQEGLDELERRDPVGFARWLAGGPVPGSDPADYVHDGRAGA